LVKVLEDRINAAELNPETFFNVIGDLESSGGVPSVGCSEHEESLTGYIVKFFVIFRINIKCQDWKKERENIRKTKSLRKSGKLL
jgi:hypothetical protein